jgi:hypothetical protein
VPAETIRPPNQIFSAICKNCHQGLKDGSRYAGPSINFARVIDGEEDNINPDGDIETIEVILQKLTVYENNNHAPALDPKEREVLVNFFEDKMKFIETLD